MTPLLGGGPKQRDWLSDTLSQICWEHAQAQTSVQIANKTDPVEQLQQPHEWNVTTQSNRFAFCDLVWETRKRKHAINQFCFLNQCQHSKNPHISFGSCSCWGLSFFVEHAHARNSDHEKLLPPERPARFDGTGLPRATKEARGIRYSLGTGSGQNMRESFRMSLSCGDLQS